MFHLAHITFLIDRRKNMNGQISLLLWPYLYKCEQGFHWVDIHCVLSPADPHWLPLSPTDTDWAPLTLTESHWAPKTPTVPQRLPLSTLTDPSDLYWAPLTSTESHWAKCSLHLPPLSYIHPSVTHNDSFLSQINLIWPQITLNNIRLSPSCLKRPQSNQWCQLSSMYATFPSKKATNHALWP